jgi:hypothetical protein
MGPALRCWRSPRSGRQHVAQGESASPGSRRSLGQASFAISSPRSGRQQATPGRPNDRKVFRCRPLRGLGLPSRWGWLRQSPRARGLALGYVLSPATRACCSPLHYEC